MDTITQYKKTIFVLFTGIYDFLNVNSPTRLRNNLVRQRRVLHQARDFKKAIDQLLSNKPDALPATCDDIEALKSIAKRLERLISQYEGGGDD